MNDKFTKLRGLIANSLNANPKSWHSFFRKYRIATYPSRPEKAIVMLYQKYGNSVLTDVNQILTTGEMDKFIGIDGEKASEVLQSGADFLKVISKKDDSTKEESVVVTTKETDEEKEAKRTKIIIGVFVGLCVVSIVTFVLIKKFK